ncbi:DUF2865 domain-containing protein [Bradyrhizobium sp.]|uniref:DUF2865 domain-containing protein n=1 Tax=Bradyrhizobium sp. TaxID=376 RepID=UPI001D945E1C|nr:DUF2865 domain-containing protein [Bradyrhizobium sp.]MBI5320139.1 DUF2865 domain-containing protein [Bradyrhizobium sp.]
MRTELTFRLRQRRALLAAAVFAGAALTVPDAALAEGLFDFFFGQKQQARQAAPPQASFFADPFGLQQTAPAPRVAGSGPAFCVRGCDGKYFQVNARGNATPAQLCQAFCPASATKVYFGSNIDYATSANGERYANSENAFAYRKALRADCTCNGRNPGGLAPIDISLDGSLRPGDVVATTSGLVAYSGIRVGNDQTAEFTPVASYPGLTAEVRARLGEMKVAPVSAEVNAEVPAVDVRELPPAITVAPKVTAQPKAKRAALN